MGECLARRGTCFCRALRRNRDGDPEGGSARATISRRAMVTRAALRQAAGDAAAARQLLHQAHAIFHALGTLDEPARVEAALAALDRGEPIGLTADE